MDAKPLMPKSKYLNKSYIAAVVLLSALVCLPSCRYFRERGLFTGRSLKKAIEQAREDSVRHANAVRKIEPEERVPEKTAEKVVVPRTEDKKEKAQAGDQEKKKESAEARISKAGGKYYIIVGSFSQQENARVRQREYLSRDFKTGLLENISKNGKKVILVYVRTFNESNEALRFLKDFQKNEDSTAWLYSAK
jgi:hypothetical protein